jgi:tetratricopeptide (TPR) repeat protein
VVQEATELDPRFVKAWYNKGINYTDLSRFKDAVRCFDHCLQLNPGFGAALISKDIALAGLGRYQDAISCFDQAIVINSRDPSPGMTKVTA